MDIKYYGLYIVIGPWNSNYLIFKLDINLDIYTYIISSSLSLSLGLININLPLNYFNLLNISMGWDVFKLLVKIIDNSYTSDKSI